jgi:hypothetical protein
LEGGADGALLLSVHASQAGAEKRRIVLKEFRIDIN